MLYIFSGFKLTSNRCRKMVDDHFELYGEMSLFWFLGRGEFIERLRPEF